MAVAEQESCFSARDFDVDYVRSQAPDLTGDPVGFYEKHGLNRRLNPTRWFVTDWYAWQNPDWTAFSTPYAHYCEVGRFQGRDPSPFVDVTRYRAMTGAEPAAIPGLIRAGLRAPAVGVYEDRADLTRCQSEFRDAIEFVAHRMMPSPSDQKALVVLQAGRGLPKEQWSDAADREWDLMVNYYDAAGFQPGLGDYVLFQKGTKFTAMWQLWRHFRDVLQRYDHVLFLDDDVGTSTHDLNRLFRLCRAHDLDLAQMTLTDRSFCNWDVLFSRAGACGPRTVSAVEIMMPVFSRAALQVLAPSFSSSVSGFGLDLAWGKMVADMGGRIAVLDEVAATHARPVDQSGGAYYRYMRKHMINPKAELWVLLQDYDADRNLVSV